jgi:hypothetical protein
VIDERGGKVTVDRWIEVPSWGGSDEVKTDGENVFGAVTGLGGSTTDKLGLEKLVPRMVEGLEEGVGAQPDTAGRGASENRAVCGEGPGESTEGNCQSAE